MAMAQRVTREDQLEAYASSFLQDVVSGSDRLGTAHPDYRDAALRRPNPSIPSYTVERYAAALVGSGTWETYPVHSRLHRARVLQGRDPFENNIAIHQPPTSLPPEKFHIQVDLDSLLMKSAKKIPIRCGVLQVSSPLPKHNFLVKDKCLQIYPGASTIQTINDSSSDRYHYRFVRDGCGYSSRISYLPNVKIADFGEPNVSVYAVVCTCSLAIFLHSPV